MLLNVCEWLGTLFERVLEPEQRSQLGAHYTSEADILTLVEPVLMAPLRREWVALLRQGLTLTSSPYGAFFYVIVGSHALHAVAAILAMAWAWRRLKAGQLTAAQFGAVEVFWYFVVLVWPVLYLRVYL